MLCCWGPSAERVLVVSATEWYLLWLKYRQRQQYLIMECTPVHVYLPTCTYKVVYIMYLLASWTHGWLPSIQISIVVCHALQINHITHMEVL